MEKKSRNNALRRDERSHASRLTISIPKGTLTALKIHVARRDTTIREIVTDLIEREITSNEQPHENHRTRHSTISPTQPDASF